MARLGDPSRVLKASRSRRTAENPEGLYGPDYRKSSRSEVPVGVIVTSRVLSWSVASWFLLLCCVVDRVSTALTMVVSRASSGDGRVVGFVWGSEQWLWLMNVVALYDVVIGCRLRE